MHQTAINEMGKTKPSTSNNQDHPLLNYLLESTPSKLKNNFMLLDP
jgi:ABC-type oligopeptide transport system ATPase subunit